MTAPQPPRHQGEGLPEALRQMLSNMAYGVSTMTEVERPLQEIEQAIQAHAAIVAEAAVRKCVEIVVTRAKACSDPELRDFAFNIASALLPPPQRETPDA